MIFFEVLNYFLLIGAGILVSYYLLISLVGLVSRKEHDLDTVKSRRFAVILVSQEAEQIFSRSLYSLSGLVYPKNKYDLFVIAESYADGIIGMAEKMGAKIMVPPKEKSQEEDTNILPWVFERILEEKQVYDAIVVFNSDGLVSGNYLEVMNFHLEQGCEIIKGSYNNLRPPNGWIEKVWEINFLMDQTVYQIGRNALGLGARNQSNGVCFSASLLREFPWRIEDKSTLEEYSFDLRLKGIEIDVVPEAVFYTDIMTGKKKQKSSLKQFYSNNYQRIKKILTKIVRKKHKTRSLKYLDILFELISPRFVNVMLFVVVMGIINGAIWLVDWISTTPVLFWLGITGVSVINVFLALVMLDSANKILKTAIYIPVNFYVKAQGIITRFFHKETGTQKGKERKRRVTVFDENEPVN